jgi:hypothetical protein
MKSPLVNPDEVLIVMETSGVPEGVISPFFRSPDMPFLPSVTLEEAVAMSITPRSRFQDRWYQPLPCPLRRT